MARPIVFLSDYGLEDEFVGVCHAVIARVAPEARVVDLAHGIPPQDVLRGALVLADAVPHAPADAVLLAVVDPGVGTPRRPVVVEAGGRLLVGPDNGLLSLAWEAAGGARRAFDISPGTEPASATFHGRDLFAPAAARLAAGAVPEELGEAVDPASLVRLEVPVAEAEPGRLRCRVVGVDRFGNAQLLAGPEDLDRAGLGDLEEIELRAAGRTVRLRRARTFGEVAEGADVLLVDSSGRLAVARNRGSAASGLGLAPGDPVVLAAPDGRG